MLDVIQWAGAVSVLAGYVCFTRKDRFWGSAWSSFGCVFFLTWSWFLDMYAILLMNLVIGVVNVRGLYLAITEGR